MSGALTRSIGRTSGAAVVSLSDLLSSYTSITGEPDPTWVVIKFKRDGSYTLTSGSGSPNVSYFYVSPRTSTVGDAYDVRVTVNSGSGPSSGLSAATWYQINAERAFQWDQSGSAGSYSGNITIEIRPFGGGGTLATSGASTITAQVNP